MKTNSDFIRGLEERIAEINNELCKLEAIINKSSPGHLKILKNKGKIQYYKILPQNELKQIYIPKKEIDTAKELAQKCYNEKVIYDLKLERNKIQELLKTYQKNNADNIYPSFSEERKKLITPINIPDEEYAAIWQSQQFTPRPFHPDDKSTHYTEKKERVRSKSEILIANKLHYMGIPYRYEAPMYLKNSLVGNVIHPDFTILNKRTRKVYYLEHLGKMDQTSYVEDNYQRIVSYERNGIIIGDSLLFTHETKNMPLDPRVVDAIIKKFFL